MSVFSSSPSAGGAAGALRLVSSLDETARLSAESQRAPIAGTSAAVDALGKMSDDASADEAWARIDLLLNQMRQLTLGGAEQTATGSTTTAQAISAYSEHSRSGAAA